MKNPRMRMSVEMFASKVLERSLYPYQIEIATAITDSVFENKGLTFTVMLARQMGKNEISAVVEAYILAHKAEGTIVKAAPTYKPQITTSRLRLLSLLERTTLADRVWRSQGYMVGLAGHPKEVEKQTGPRVIYLSAGHEAHVVGSTASLLLEVDEA